MISPSGRKEAGQHSGTSEAAGSVTGQIITRSFGGEITRGCKFLACVYRTGELDRVMRPDGKLLAVIEARNAAEAMETYRWLATIPHQRWGAVGYDGRPSEPHSCPNCKTGANYV